MVPHIHRKKMGRCLKAGGRQSERGRQWGGAETEEQEVIAVSQGCRVEDEEDSHTFDVSMMQVGWQMMS